MAKEILDPKLLERIELVDDPAYEGEPLTGKDYMALVVVGLLAPFLLMIWGWMI